jgi:hypothetical protein
MDGGNPHQHRRRLIVAETPIQEVWMEQTPPDSETASRDAC